MGDIVNISLSQAEVWEQDNIRVRRSQSVLRFVMPVAFPEMEGHGGYRFEQRVDRLASTECWQLLGGETQGFLSHVRMHLNTCRPYSGGGDELRIDPSGAFGYIFESTEPADLPLPRLDFCFRVPGAGRFVDVDIVAAQAGIFRLGVGFACLELKPRSDSLPDWLDALHFLRFYRARGEKLRSVHSPQDSNEMLRMEDFLGPILAAAALDGERSPFPSRDDARGHPHGRRIKELYTRGEFLTYVVLFSDGIPADDQRRFLYTVANRFRSASQVMPSEEDDEDQWRLPYQGGQQFLNTIEGSAFVAFDAGHTQFDLNTLPFHLRTTYFTLFLLALLQRFALDQLSESVALSTGRVLSESERGHARGELKRITSLDARLLDFTSRCYFVQVSQTEHHHTYYKRLRDVNQIEERYREVTEEIHALRAHAASRVSVEQERTSLRVAAALMVITCVLLPLQVIEALFAAKLPQLPGIRALSPAWSAATAGLVLLGAIAVALLILSGGWRRHRRHR